MNTLSRAITARIFTNPTEYNALKRHWSTLVNSERKHDLTPAHHVLYLALLGKDWRKAFTPVTNPKKLANGAFHGWALFYTFMRLHSRFHEDQLLAPFDGLVTKDMLAALRHYLPTPRTCDYPSNLYKQDAFPLDAYVQPVESAHNA